MKTRLINSTILLLAAYYVVHFTYLIAQFLSLLVLDMKGLSMYFFYNSYPQPEHSWWSRLKVFMVCSSGIVSIFILMFVIIILKAKLSRKKIKLDFFYNWILIVCSAFIVSEFLAAPLFGDATFMFSLLRWLRFEAGGGGMYFLALIFLLIIPIAGYFFHLPFLKMTNTTAFIKTKFSRFKLYTITAFLPFLILCVAITLMINTYYTYDIDYVLSREVMRLSVLGTILLFGAYFGFNKNYIAIQKSNDFHIMNKSINLFLVVFMIAIFFISFLHLD